MHTTSLQSFDYNSSPETSARRVLSLQKLLLEKNLSGFLVPRSDLFQGENVAKTEERLAWLTGFNGSAGFCAVLQKSAAIFVDGRYKLQVKSQVPDSIVQMDWPKTSLIEWLRTKLESGDILGFDPWLHTLEQIEELKIQLNDIGVEIKPVDNLVDIIWKDKPDQPINSTYIYPTKYAGKSRLKKILDVKNELQLRDENGFVFTNPESLCWLLNIRGKDINRTPITHCTGIVHLDSRVDLFIDPAKTSNIKIILKDTINFFSPDKFEAFLKLLKGPIGIDPEQLPYAAFLALEKGDVKIVRSKDPTELPKAKKNKIELTNAKKAHLRDAISICKFLFWFNCQPIENLTEIDIAISLEKFRRANPEFKDLSFDTISASGPNAALPHYRVTTNSNRTLNRGEVILIDSGAQYLDGTTDVTRTIGIDVTNSEICESYTRVFKGLVAVSKLQFPKGTCGKEIDVLARKYLWENGQDFNHGTGHGVGHFLNVHEGPQRISKTSLIPLEEGMIISNEPGYYKEGGFGIRIENLLVVRASKFMKVPHNAKFLSFETLTFVPIDKNLLVKSMLSETEKDWLNTYHKECRKKITAYLSKEEALWLRKVTEPI